MEEALSRALALPRGRRHLIALAGPPASGKTTLSTRLADAITQAGRPSVVVPMDGFHLDNALLSQRGLLARKGAPETFDARGLGRLLEAIVREDRVVYPLFDRVRDLSIAGAAEIAPETEIVVVEGNYLLLDEPPWRALSALFSLRLSLDVPEAVLRERLVARWLDHGLDAEAALARAEGNDLPNARLTLQRSRGADLVLSEREAR